MFKNYRKFWLATREQLNDLRIREKVIQKLNETTVRNDAHRIFASLYARYVMLCNNLSELYDQTLQVQKRKVVEKLLESATLRLLQLEKEMLNVELSEFIYTDDEVKEYHFVPQDVQLLKPFYFPRDRREDIKQIIDQKVERGEDDLTESEEKLNIRMECVLLIQTHERARQGRRIQTELKKLMTSNKKNRGAAAGDTNAMALKLKPRNVITYNFYHKPAQMPLIPVKRTIFQTNFCKEIYAISEYSFYKPLSDIDNAGNMKTEAQKVAQVEFDFVLDESKIPKKIIEDEPRNVKYDAHALPTCSQIPVNRPIENLIKIKVMLKERSSEIFIDVDAARREEQKRIESERNEKAAWIIQRNWLIYKNRKLTQRRRVRRMAYLGLIPGDKWDRSIYNKLEQAQREKRSKKELFDQEFERAIKDEKARIVKIKSPFIIEDISDHIREWFREFYYTTGTFDKYPEEFKEGTILVLRGETMTPTEYLIEAAKTPQQKAAEKKKDKDQKKLKKEKLKALKMEMKQRIIDRKTREKKDGVKIWQFKYPENISKKFIDLDQTMDEYEKEWYFIDEMKNVKPIMEWITETEMAGLHMDLRKQVDVYMRTEHELLMMALAKDKKVRYRPPKAKKQKKKKKKMGKQKKVKDSTATRSVQSLYEELIQRNIIKKYPKCKLDDFIGDRNYLAQDQRMEDSNPSHCAGDIIHIIRNSILGMGDFVFPKPKSMLFAGPPLTGKKFLAHAICTETDAILFDLSPENTSQLESNDADYLLELVMKMAKILQPSVILINNLHKVFYKKIPADEAHLPNPRLLGPLLFKRIVKGINPNDRVMLIGCTNAPFKGKPAPIKKCFEKKLFFPTLNYGCTFYSWWKACDERPYISPLIELSPLAAVTVGQTTGKIVQTIDKVLTIHRRLRLPFQPLRGNELLESLLSNSPPDLPMQEKEYAKYMKWWQKSNPLAKSRAALLAKKIAEQDAKKKKK